MTTFEITIIVLLTAIVVLLIVLLRTSIEGFHGVWQNQQCLYNLLNNADDANRKFYLTLNDYLSDLAVNVKGNYNTLEQQQEDIKYIRMRVNHILSLMHPAKEVIKPDAPTVLDGLSNVQKDNANKSTNYNGYDPTFIVKGSETTDALVAELKKGGQDETDKRTS